MADIRQEAVATARSYNQGDIASLDDAMTRRLVASVVLTESRGGDLEITNRQGFVGRYQAGAEFLANAGYLYKEKHAEGVSGFKSEWAWANSGGMTKFLENQVNWTGGLSLDQYKRSPELQDRAFKINAGLAYDRAVHENVLKDGDKPEKVAGFLKAEHMMGYGAAKSAANGERVFRGPDGISNYDYMHHISRNRDGLDQYIQQAALDHSKPAQDKSQSAAHEKLADTGVLISHDNHKDKPHYDRVYELLGKVSGINSESERQNAAGYIVWGSKMREMVAHTISEQGDWYPRQHPDTPFEKAFKVNPAEAKAYPIAESTKQIDALNRQIVQTPESPQQTRNIVV